MKLTSEQIDEGEGLLRAGGEEAFLTWLKEALPGLETMSRVEFAFRKYWALGNLDKVLALWREAAPGLEVVTDEEWGGNLAEFREAIKGLQMKPAQLHITETVYALLMVKSIEDGLGVENFEGEAKPVQRIAISAALMGLLISARFPDALKALGVEIAE